MLRILPILVTADTPARQTALR